MRKRARRIVLFIIAFVALLVGGVYEASTHVVRGWLRGEAFYDGRPTSWWRVRCDDWLNHFRTADDAALSIPHQISNGDPDGAPRSSAILILTPPKTVWTHINDAFRSKADLRRDWHAPAVLVGAGDSEHVLRELAVEVRLKRVAERALWLNKKYRELELAN